VIAKKASSSSESRVIKVVSFKKVLPLRWLVLSDLSSVDNARISRLTLPIRWFHKQLTSGKVRPEIEKFDLIRIVRVRHCVFVFVVLAELERLSLSSREKWSAEEGIRSRPLSRFIAVSYFIKDCGSCITQNAIRQSEPPRKTACQLWDKHLASP
jgi:hypothetical protein